MIFTRGYTGRIQDESIGEYTEPAGASFGLAASLGFEDTAAHRIFDFGREVLAGGEKLTKEQAAAKAKEHGVELDSIGPDGISSGALDVLIERQKKRHALEERLSRSNSTMAQVAGGFAGGALDPLLYVIPAFGAARYEKALAAMSGPVTRAALRFGYGAAHGAVGAAALEPINYTLGQQLGDDYTAANSLANVTMGTLLGGGLHMGAGAIGDAIKAGIDWRVAKGKGRAVEEALAMGQQGRSEKAVEAIRQALDDEFVRVNHDPAAPAEAPTSRMEAPDLVAEQQAKLDSVLPRESIEEAQAQLNEAMSSLKPLLEATGHDIESVLASADEEIGRIDELGRGVEAMGACFGRAGG